MSRPSSPEQRLAEGGPAGPIILSVAFPYAPIGPKAVGGAEVICSQIEAHLPQAGFKSVVVAHADSLPAGRLYATHVPGGIITDSSRLAVEAAHQANIDRALAENDVALVHMHGLDFDRYRIPAAIPILVTLHLPPAWYPQSIWGLPDNYHLLCVSETQRRSCPASAQHRIAVIPNGVPLPDPATLRTEGRYALMLARICPEKNLHAGFDAARLADMPAMLAGEVFPYETHLRYLEDEIRPRLTASNATHEPRLVSAPERPGARFLGPVAGEEKQRLLARAACLLLPSLAPETSSLVAMEALAAGVPVIGMAVGAVPEIVEHGLTGFLVPPGDNATAELSQALGKLPLLDRGRCRATAEERFPLSRMIEAYLRLYRQLARPQPTARIPSAAAPPPAPAATAHQQALTLEPITANSALDALAPEWTALWAADPHATPFQHPAWLLPWWRQFGPDGKLCALALRQQATRQLVGWLPLYTYTPPSSGQRQLLLLGAGTTDYLDGVWTPRAIHAAQQALDHVATLRIWDHLSFQQLRRPSPLLRAAEAAGLPLTEAEPCSILDTATDLPAKMRVNLGRYRRLAEAQGALQCDLAASPEQALRTFDRLVERHSRRWEERGEEGVLRDPRVLAHHRESLPLLLEAGLLGLFHLTLNGETMGVLYSLADPPHAAERSLYLYLIGFNARFAALSPGSLLVHEAWHHAREQGFSKIDFLRGGEAYKKLWGAQPQPTYALNLDQQTPTNN